MWDENVWLFWDNSHQRLSQMPALKLARDAREIWSIVLVIFVRCRVSIHFHANINKYTFCDHTNLDQYIVSFPKLAFVYTCMNLNHIKHPFNSLVRLRCGCILQLVIFRVISSQHRYIEQLLQRSPQLNATRPYWWLVNAGSGNSLVPSGTKPFLKPLLTKLCVDQVIRPRPQSGTVQNKIDFLSLPADTKDFVYVSYFNRCFICALHSRCFYMLKCLDDIIICAKTSSGQ